ncbi:hypothetical protein Bca4012_018207 [Brassica carinata]
MDGDGEEFLWRVLSNQGRGKRLRSFFAEPIPSSCLANEMDSDSVKLPEFSYFIYHLLVDLHNIFNGIPALRKALDRATEKLSDVNRGEVVDKEALLSEFSKLSSTEKSYALMADNIVAVVDAGLVFYEKGIMCAAETLPSDPSIAKIKMGHGIQNLREASQEVTGRENKRIPRVMEGLN